MTSDEACRRLGVRSQTLYAYVSRGRLTPRREGRRSLFDVHELDRLASQSRRANRSGRLEILVDTELTLLDPAGRLHYRGVDAAVVARTWSYERTARWLWTGSDAGEPPPWVAPAAWVAQAADAPGATLAERLRAATAAIGAVAPRERDDLAGTGASLVAALVASLPARQDRPSARIAGVDRDDSIAARLWPRLTGLAPEPRRLALLNAALVLLADHELAVSTLAARVAASAWAPPVDVVLAGLAAHGGVLHGGATSAVHRALRRGETVPTAFGHTVYEGADPRAEVLLAMLEDVLPPVRWRPIERAAATGAHPNADFALGALAAGFDFVDGAGEAVFALARIAGWLAHAGEEYERPLRFRARASYVGPPPLR